MHWMRISSRQGEPGGVSGGGLWAAILAPALLLFFLNLAPQISGQTGSDPANRGKEAGEGYVGSHACSRCHGEIYRKFSQTSMGRSMSPVSPALPAAASTNASYVHAGLKRRFEVYSADGKLFQSESGIGADGKETFRDAHQVAWIIGAGVNGFGGIVQKNDSLFQAPLSFYSKLRNWAPSPGYEFADLGFNRPILPGCIFCHSGRPNSVAGSSGQFEATPFSELAIGCERCHGPGADHIAAMRGTSALAAKKSASVRAGQYLDNKIVNPARLSPYLADNICMACHQTGDVRVLKPG